MQRQKLRPTLLKCLFVWLKPFVAMEGEVFDLRGQAVELFFGTGYFYHNKPI